MYNNLVWSFERRKNNSYGTEISMGTLVKIAARCKNTAKSDVRVL